MNEDQTQSQEGWKEVGAVSHFFDKIAVAALKLSDELKNGDKIKFEKVGLEQIVSSMQISQQVVEQAKSGDEVGIKVEALSDGQKIHEGEKVLKAI